MSTRRLTAAQARALATWVDAVRPVSCEADVRSQAELVNGLLAGATTSVRVSMHDGRDPHLH